MKLAIAVFEAGAAAFARPIIDLFAPEDDIPVFATGAAVEAIGRKSKTFTEFEAAMANCQVLLMSATANSIEAKLRIQASKLGLPVIQIIDGSYHFARRFRYESNVPSPGNWPDAILMTDETAVRDASDEGLPEQRLFAVGNPAWESCRKLPRGDRGFVLFVDQPLQGDALNDLGYTEWDCLNGLTDGIAASNGRWRNLRVCLHPRRLGENPFPVASVNAGQGLRSAEVVVGMYSSLMVDAYLGGKPVISFQPANQGQNKDILSRQGIAPLATNLSQLAAALSKVADNSNIHARQNPFTGSLERSEAVLRRTARAEPAA